MNRKTPMKTSPAVSLRGIRRTANDEAIPLPLAEFSSVSRRREAPCASLLQWTLICTAVAAIATLAVLVSAAPADTDIDVERYERLRKISYELMKIEPLIHRIEELQDVILTAKATSPTLEQLEDIEIKADLVKHTQSILARVEAIEPVIQSLEAMQRDFTRRARANAGVAAKRPETWSAIFDQLQSRLDALEKRILAPAVLRDPVTARKPIEIRLDELETRQKELERENEQLRTELRRLRRERDSQLP